MDLHGSITHWISLLKAGDQQAVAPLWERYFNQLLLLARQRLRAGSRAVADEEDVALSALDSFCRGLEQGRFPQLMDRNGLWPLLVVITERKAIDWFHNQQRLKRGGGKVLGESALEGGEDSSLAPGMGRVPDPLPDPALAALLAEECQRLLGQLDERLRALALLKMEGYSNQEIAKRLGCALRTVERKLERIRDLWEEELAP